MTGNDILKISTFFFVFKFKGLLLKYLNNPKGKFHRIHTFWHLVRFQSSNLCNSLYAKKKNRSIQQYWNGQNRSLLPKYTKQWYPVTPKTLISQFKAPSLNFSWKRIKLRSFYLTKSHQTPSHQRWHWMTCLMKEPLPLLTCSSYLYSCYEPLPSTVNLI